MTYSWKSGARISLDAQIAGDLCNQLSKSEQGLSPESLLEASRPEAAPLHTYFEWDDKAAAEQYRLSQAGHVIRSLEIAISEVSKDAEEGTTRAFVTVTPKQYTRIDLVLRDAHSTERLLDQAHREFEQFKRKYETLKALSPLFDAAEKLFA